jgi:hypothetical protein
MILVTPVRRECCIVEHKQVVLHRVVQSGFAELDQMLKIFIVFYQIMWLITVILVLYINKITFIPLSHKHRFFNIYFNIILKLFTLTSAAMFAHTKLSTTYFFYTSPHLSIYILN